jgi:hypothetical protein
LHSLLLLKLHNLLLLKLHSLLLQLLLKMQKFNLEIFNNLLM